MIKMHMHTPRQIPPLTKLRQGLEKVLVLVIRQPPTSLLLLGDLAERLKLCSVKQPWHLHLHSLLWG